MVNQPGLYAAVQNSASKFLLFSFLDHFQAQWNRICESL